MTKQTTPEDDAPIRARKDDVVDHMAVVGRSILINRPRSELFAYWSDLSNLPGFMDNLESIESAEGGRSRWIVKAPLGTVLLETEMVGVVPDQIIAWSSTRESEIRTEGRIEFVDAPGGRGTIVTLDIGYEPPAGNLGRLAAKLFGREPNIQARQELKRFKMLMETGEISRGPDQLKKED